MTVIKSEPVGEPVTGTFCASLTCISRSWCLWTRILFVCAASNLGSDGLNGRFVSLMDLGLWQGLGLFILKTFLCNIFFFF